jgi:hypothetical protein
VAILAAWLAACEGRGTAEAVASTPPQAPGGTAGSEQPRVTLAFDLPPETGDSASEIIGFEVGYFGPGPLRTPAALVEVPREAVSIQGSAVRLSVVLPALPEGGTDVALRVRTKTRSGISAWSEPTAIVSVPALPASQQRASSAAATRANERRQRRGLSVSDLDPYPALREAIERLLSPGLSLDEAVRPFRNVSNLANAVAVSRQRKLPFAELLEALEGPPRRSLREALQVVEPSLDARRALRDARDEGSRLAAAGPSR